MQAQAAVDPAALHGLCPSTENSVRLQDLCLAVRTAHEELSVSRCLFQEFACAASISLSLSQRGFRLAVCSQRGSSPVSVLLRKSKTSHVGLIDCDTMLQGGSQELAGLQAELAEANRSLTSAQAAQAQAVAQQKDLRAQLEKQTARATRYSSEAQVRLTACASACACACVCACACLDDSSQQHQIYAPACRLPEARAASLKSSGSRKLSRLQMSAA